MRIACVAVALLSCGDSIVPEPEILVEDQGGAMSGGPLGLTVTRDGVFWSNPSSGHIGVLRPGSREPQVFADGQLLPGHMASDATHVYWVTFGANTVARARADGTDAPAMLATDQQQPLHVAVHESVVYWADNGGTTVKAVPSSGGTIDVVASGLNGPHGVFADNDGVYWTVPSDGLVMSRRRGSSEVVVLATGQAGADGVATDAVSVYWTNTGDGRVMKVLKNSPAEPVTLATDQMTPDGIAVSLGRVFWTTFGDGAVRSVPVEGGPIVTHATTTPPVQTVVAAGDHIYWTSAGAGTVSRLRVR